MEPYRFSCPYCSGEFGVDERPGGQPVVCPHCDRTVALAAEPPEPILEAETAEAAAGAPTAPAARQESVSRPSAPPIQPQPSLRQRQSLPSASRLSRQEKDRRRLRRNLVLMTVGMIVLAIALAVLSQV